ncbi:ATP-binding protein [Actinoplanes sp. NPDC023714]|uniref:ATP-binding protein n=1 Tax=Actinoplanes sp. NPDC023714 TaxID=3154322 RepID=UPI0033D1D982
MLLLVLVAVLGLAGTAAASLGLWRGEERLAARAADQQAARVAEAVTDGVRRYSDYLTGLAASVGAQQTLEAEEFAAIAAPIDRTNLPGVTGLAYVVPSTPAQIGEVQAYWRAHGADGLVLRPGEAGARNGQHLFIVLGHSADTVPTPVGGDLTATPAAVAAMRAARQSRELVMSATHHLIKDRALPAEKQQASFVMAAAIHATAPARDAGWFRGWLLLGLRAGDFLRATVEAVATQASAVRMMDPGTDGDVPLVLWKAGRESGPGRLDRQVSVDVLGRTWDLTIQPAARLVDRRGPAPYVIALYVGGVISLLLLALTATVTTSRDRAVRRVREATTALRTDIARREAVEQQLRHRETELRGFAGIVAHDLRAPLARITGYAELLAADAADRLAPDERDMLGRLHDGANRMTMLIDDLLDYATADNTALRMAPVDLGPLLAEIIRDHAGAVFTVGSLPVVEGDVVLLRQVFANLVGNAVKYCAPGRRPRIDISARRAGDRWRIEVADNGIGVPPDQVEAVFTAFTRVEEHRHYPGTGLGLAIVHRIVQRHGGEIGVEPNPDGGSRFWLTLGAAA